MNPKDYAITSAFIGAAFEGKPFFDVYVELNQYILDNNLQDAVSLQDIHTMHVTLHYLDKDVSQETLHSIKLDAVGPIQITGFNYFYGNDQAKVCYFELSDQEQLAVINQKLAAAYPSDALENNLDFVAHATLFRVIDYTKFTGHQQGLEKIVSNFVEHMMGKNLETKMNVFLVNSKFTPELQVPLL